MTCRPVRTAALTQADARGSARLSLRPVPTYTRSHSAPFPLTRVPTQPRSHLHAFPLSPVPTYGPSPFLYTGTTAEGPEAQRCGVRASAEPDRSIGWNGAATTPAPKGFRANPTCAEPAASVSAEGLIRRRGGGAGGHRRDPAHPKVFAERHIPASHPGGSQPHRLAQRRRREWRNRNGKSHCALKRALTRTRTHARAHAGAHTQPCASRGRCVRSSVIVAITIPIALMG
jgi:hypothetical protein